MESRDPDDLVRFENAGESSRIRVGRSVVQKKGHRKTVSFDGTRRNPLHAAQIAHQQQQRPATQGYLSSYQLKYGPDYTVQTMNMSSVLDPELQGKFKRRVPIAPAEAPVNGSCVLSTGAGGVIKPTLMTQRSQWNFAQLQAAASVRNYEMKPHKRLTGKHAMTKAQEVEWRMSDGLPALADNSNFVRKQNKQTQPSEEPPKAKEEAQEVCVRNWVLFLGLKCSVLLRHV